MVSAVHLCAACVGPLPVRPPYRAQATHCSYWCHLVTKGVYTLEQITPWLRANRGHRA